MSTTVVKQFVATINSGSQVNWVMSGVCPLFNQELRRDAQPKWVVQWQAVPLIVDFDASALDDPKFPSARAGMIVGTVTVVQEGWNRPLSHVVTVSCTDIGNNILTPVKFVVTYVLYAIFHDVP